MSFQHGVKTTNVPGVGAGTNLVESAVIALIGVSPIGTAQDIILCNNEKDDAQFGENTPNNNIAKTLYLIRETVKAASVSPSDGSCPVIVVNVYSAASHKAALSATATPDTAGKAALAVTIVGDLDSVEIEADGDPVNEAAGGTYVYGTDYTLDRYGNFIDITGTYIGEELTFTGFKLNTAGVLAAHIIGANTSGTRTGSYLFELCKSKFGFVPKVFIAPTYNTLTGVAARLATLANANRGIHISDAAAGTTLSAALALRTSGIWATVQPCTRPVFPWMKSFDAMANAEVAYPFSAHLAGLYAANDSNVGAWQSVSNQQIPLVTAPELDITGGYTQLSSEANQLNAKGILTYIREGAIKTWGNRNASYDSSSDVTTFDNVYRMDGIVAETMEKAAGPYVDKGITPALIDIMKTQGNNLIKTLIQKGALLPGSSVYYDKTKNSAQELANGHVIFTRRYMITTPMELAEFENILDINLFNNLNK